MCYLTKKNNKHRLDNTEGTLFMKMTDSKEEHRAVLRIVAIYAFWGALWIYLSDAVLDQIVHDPHSMTIVATYKGLLFIALTSSLLYFLIHRYVASIREKSRQLKISEERFQSIFHGISDAIFIHDALTGGILSVNRTACELFGYTCEEMLTMDVDSLSLGEAPYSQNEAMARMQGTLQGIPQKFQWKCKRKDGGIFWSEVNMRGDLLEDRQCIIVSVRDITDRKQAEEIVQKKEQQYRLLFENMTSGFALHEMIYDNDGQPFDYRFLEVNPEFEKQTGIQAASILGRTVKEVLPDTESYWIETYDNVARTGEPLSYQHYSKGLEKYFDCWVFSPGKDLFAVIFSDITEKTHLEEQLRQAQKMEAVGQLAGGIAHDFNNILQVIIGYATILNMENRMDPKQQEEIGHILSAAEKAARLTNGLLAFSRRQVMDPKEVDLKDIVQNVQNLLVRVIGEDIRLQSKTDESPLPVKVDGTQIEQALINLATNARDSMPHGGTLTIETAIQHADSPLEHAHGYGEPGRYACITISDTGCGMEEEIRCRIFEPFFTTKEVGKGTGLGMAIVYGIIKQHNGFINVYSEPGHGTTFRMYLPLATAEQGANAHTPCPAPSQGGSETILLAEDDISVRKLLVSVLTSFGYNLIQATDGEEVVEKFAANQDKISLILMDMIMPKRNGMEAYAEISRLKPGVKVLYVSGYTADFIQGRGVSDTGINLIMKPLQPSELLQKVREILDGPPHCT